MTDTVTTGLPRVIVAVVGATASGKTGLSLALADRLEGEVVNTDAMQLYRGMDVGTAKLPEAERRGVPHHLLDRLDIGETSTVAHFQTWARDLIASLRARDRTPVLVGGSALYTRAVLDRFEFPGTDEGVRRALEDELAALGPAGPLTLHRRLGELDPEAAGRIETENARRTIRALEVIALTGRAYSASLPTLTYADPLTVQIGVDIDRPTLDARIEQRVAAMFADGLVEEVAALLERGLADAPTASRAIGYREATAYLTGNLSLDEAQEQTAARTRRFSRRQDGWFRKDPRIVWVQHDDPGALEVATGAVRKVVEAHCR
jgi:tRNA dimethylallyltransferase